jgi:hypothetical protein
MLPRLSVAPRLSLRGLPKALAAAVSSREDANRSREDTRGPVRRDAGDALVASSRQARKPRKLSVASNSNSDPVLPKRVL